MRSATSASRRPRSAFTRAAVALIRPSQRMTGTGIGCPDTGKLATAFFVSPPQSSRRSSVALMQWNLALRQSSAQSALISGTPTAQAARLGLHPPDELGAESAARGASPGRSDQVAQLERRAGLALLRVIVEPLRRGEQIRADDLDVGAAGVPVEATGDRRALQRHRAGCRAQRAGDHQRAL